jgi:hypothetical protein
MMVKDIYDYLSKYQYEGRLITDFIYAKVNSGKRFLFPYNTVIEQDEVKQKFADLKKAYDKMNDLIKLFTSGVRILSEDIELGRTIKGKCSVGY